MMLVNVDPLTKTVGIVSIPRDSRVRVDGHGMDKINAAHAFGGPELAVATVQKDFGVPVDRYLVIDTQGLKKVFQVLGPVEVLVEKRMNYVDHAAGLHVNLEPGVHRLTPEQLEEYVRFRHDARGDIGRIERQQWFIRAMTNKLKEPQVVWRLPELIQLAHEYVQTDLSLEEMAKLANFGKDIQPQAVQTATLPGVASSRYGGSYWLLDPFGSAIVFNRLLGTSIDASEAGSGLDREMPASDEAYAATTDIMDSEGRPNEPVRISLKYARGLDGVAKTIQNDLIRAGYKVKLKYAGNPAECAHEAIIENSFRADADLTQKLRSNLSIVQNWPVILSLEKRSAEDFTLVLSPNVKREIAGLN